jgi:hypothetical protein
MASVTTRIRSAAGALHGYAAFWLQAFAQPTIDRCCARRKQAVRDSFELRLASRDLLYERIERTAMRNRGRETLDLFFEQFLAPAHRCEIVRQGRKCGPELATELAARHLTGPMSASSVLRILAAYPGQALAVLVLDLPS